MTAMSTPAPPAPSMVRRLIPIAVAIAAMVFVIWRVPFKDRCTSAGCDPGLLSTLREINPWLLAAAFAAYSAGTFAWALRWRELLRPAKVAIGPLAVWRIILEAQAGGVLLPGGVGGDALRIAYIRTRVPSSDLTKVIASIMTDRIMGLVTLMGMAAAMSILSGGTQSIFVWALAAAPLGALAGFAVLRNERLRKLKIFSEGRVAGILRPIFEYASDREGLKALARGTAIAILVAASQLIVIRIFIAALGAHPTAEGAVYVGTTFGMIVAALPLAPGGWGTADAAYVFFLGRAGVPAPVAAAVCLLYRMFWYANAVVGAALTLGGRKK